MKKIIVTAAALMFGTSALAWAPAEKAHMDAMGIESARSDWSKSGWSAEKSPLSFSSFDDTNVMKMESAGVESSATMSKAEDSVPAIFAKWEDPSVESSATAAASADAGLKSSVDMASADAAAAAQSASWDGKADTATTQQSGMGGPVEEAQGYPPCDPGPGDDRCIQLYEPGVHAELAAWKGSEPNVGMGGPYEPAATGSKDQSAGHADHQNMDHGQSGSAMPHGSGHGTADASKPAEPMADSGAMKPAADPATAGTSPGAIGGPIESQSGYPPCRPGRGDDRCIQLYERGVTGRRN